MADQIIELPQYVYLSLPIVYFPRDDLSFMLEDNNKMVADSVEGRVPHNGVIDSLEQADALSESSVCLL